MRLDSHRICMLFVTLIAVSGLGDVVRLETTNERLCSGSAWISACCARKAVLSCGAARL